jgi:hypothetical protein
LRVFSPLRPRFLLPEMFFLSSKTKAFHSFLPEFFFLFLMLSTLLLIPSQDQLEIYGTKKFSRQEDRKKKTTTVDFE